MSKIKKTILIISASAIGLFVVWYVTARIYSFHGNKIEEVEIGNRKFYAEVVSSPEKLQKGLGDRNSLCRSCAMLFRFYQPNKYAFWMKDMCFDLDILWVLEKKIVALEKNVSKNKPDILNPQVSADHVLEINAGMIDKLGIKVGDEMSF